MKKALLAKRSYGYVVGICILPAGTLGFLAGFVSPYWHFVRTATGTVTVHGLWMVCYQVSSSLVGCDQTIIRADNWLRVVQFLEVVALFLLLLACVFIVLLNFARSDHHSRLLEIFAGFGATFAFFGSLCYLFTTYVTWTTDSVAYNWAFGINMAGSLLSIIAVVLIATNNPSPVGKTARGDNKRPPANRRGMGENILWLYNPFRRPKISRGDGFRGNGRNLRPANSHLTPIV